MVRISIAETVALVLGVATFIVAMLGLVVKIIELSRR
ncbi:putative holin-like toxin [Sphingomonas solaris]